MGQKIPEDKKEIINIFIREIISKRKELYKEEDKDYRIINILRNGL